MPLTVKRKIQLGTLFLFLLLLLTGGAGIYFTTTLQNETKAVLQDNYESVAYCHIMQQQADSFSYQPAKSLVLFEKNLVLQEHNITEPGEGDATQRLRSDFEQLKAGDTTRQNLDNLHNDIQTIINLNMHAMWHKDRSAQQTARNAVNIIISLVAIVFLISFSFSFNFPSLLTNPINELTEGIRAISNKDYKHRIHITNKDEFSNLADAFNTMAERLEYFESSNLNKLMFEKSRAEAVINSLKDASIGIDKDNIVLFANFHALELLGMKVPDIVGKTVADISVKNDLFRFLVSDESSAPFKIVVDNHENYFTREAMDVAQSEGSSRVIVVRNITSFKELDAAKTNFIATISHELKTPLAASDLGLKLLEDERTGSLTAEQRELITNLKDDNRRILKILSELLNMSQVETGKITLSIESVSPSRIVDQALETVAAALKEKNLELREQTASDLPNIAADEEKTTWVLNNFLTNAIKYSPVDGIIQITAKRLNGGVLFSVADQGNGIPKEYIPRLFERYFQVPGAKVKGTGLGLSISKDFIEAQNGKIWVESETGKGAVFSFTLPVFTDVRL